MSRLGVIEARLLRWAEAVTVGDGSGYPSMSVLHENWSPPGGGVTPTMKAAPARSDAAQTHRAIGHLSVRLQNTLVVHYCLRLPMAEQAARLQCGERTVRARIELAHRKLAALLT